MNWHFRWWATVAILVASNSFAVADDSPADLQKQIAAAAERFHQAFEKRDAKALSELFKKHGFEPVFKESKGGHTWINWQQYLNEFAPQLFQ